MNKKELVDLYYDVEEACEERRRLGEFDANSKYVMLALEGLRVLLANTIEGSNPRKEVKLLPPPAKRKGRK